MHGCRAIWELSTNRLRCAWSQWIPGVRLQINQLIGNGMAKNKTGNFRNFNAAVTPKMRDRGLAGTFGLVVSFSVQPVMAHNAVTTPIAFTTPTSHATHTTTSPTTTTTFTHSSASNANNVTTTTPTHIHAAATTNLHTAAPSTTTSTTSSTTQKHTVTAHTAVTSTGQVLDLSSSAATYTLGTLGNFKTVTIDVGGKIETVNATTKLTSAELLAADQALNSKSSDPTQSLTINANGVATGGDFTLNGSTLRTLDTITGGISSLTIPTHVTLDDKVRLLDITGALTNNGTINAESKSSAGTTLEATTITNAAGAAINGTGALTLTAAQTLSNAGSINGTGAVTINAATVQNTATTGTPTISAGTGHDLTLNAATINNSGTLSAGNNVNFTGTQSVVVNQTAHASVTAGGDINFRDSSYNGAGDLTLNGGNYLSQNLNLYAPTGNVNVDAGNITGQLNGTVGAIHTNTQAANLTLGNLNITGDPEFYNTGTIYIGGLIQETGGVPLAIVAGGSILSSGGSLITDGGDLTLIAGAKYTTNDGTVNFSTAPNWNTILTINGASATGGAVNLTGSAGTAPIGAISTAAVTAGDGGDVTMVAYAGSAANSGTVILPATSLINTNGINRMATHTTTDIDSNNGNVTIIANGTSPNGAIAIGSIVADAAWGGGGVITLASATPVATGTTVAGKTVAYELVNGQPFGTFTPGTATGTGIITIGGSVSGYQALANTFEVGGTLTVTTNGAVSIKGNLEDEGIFVTTGAAFTQSTNWTAGGISVTTPGAFVQAAGSTVIMDGEGGQYNISAGSVVFNGTTGFQTQLSPGTLNVTTAANSNDIISSTGVININNAVFNNASTITVNGALGTNTNPDGPPGSGNLTFNNSGNIQFVGTGTINNSGTFTATATGNITISSTNAPGINASGTNPNGWVFNAGGFLALPTNSLTVSADPTTGNGGTVNLTYHSVNGVGLAYPGSATSPFIITANAGNGTAENGGIVNINVQSTIGVAVGNQPGNFEITANSGSISGVSAGGNVSVTSIGPVLINPTYLSNTGYATGGTLSFTSTTGNIVVTGGLNEAPIGPGGQQANFGNITFSTPGTNIGFTVGGVTNNGVQGNLVGNVSIVTPTTVIVAAGSEISGNQINLTAPSVTNNGTIMGLIIGTQVTSDISVATNTYTMGSAGEIGAQVNVANGGTSLIGFAAPTGNLTMAGSGTYDKTFGYSFSAPAGIVNMGPVFNVTGSAAQSPIFDQLNISALTTINIANNLLTTDGGATGKINISAATLNYGNAATTPFRMVADGSDGKANPQDGIYLNLTTAATKTVGTAAGQFEFSAEKGTTGGTLSFINAGALIVNETPAALNNKDGNLILTAATNLEIIGGIAQGTGAVSLTSTAPTSTFIVGSPTNIANGISGNIAGGQITISEKALTINSGATINGEGMTFNTNAFTNNGTLTIAAVNVGDTLNAFAVIGNGTAATTLTFVNNGSIVSPTEISINTPASFTPTGTGTYAITGQYSFTGNAVNLTNLFTTQTQNEFSQLDITSTGLVTLGTNDLKTQGLLVNVISIVAGDGLTYKNLTTTPLTLDASSATGGGSVSYSVPVAGATPVIGGGAKQITINTSETMAGGTAVGNISITGGGGVTVNPLFLITNSVNDSKANTNISIAGLAGNVLISSGSAATGWSADTLGPTGNLTISSASATPFVIGATGVTTNGILTSTAITGNNLSITNTKGGITLGLLDTLQGNANGGSVTMSATGVISGLANTETVLAPVITITSTGSTVGTATNSLIVSTQAMPTASSVNLSGTTGVYVTDNSAGFVAMPGATPTIILSATAPTVVFTADNAKAPLVMLPNGLVNSTNVTITAVGSTSSQGIETNMNIGNDTGVVTLNAGTNGPSALIENPQRVTNTIPPIFIEGTTVNLTGNSAASTDKTLTPFEIVANNVTYNGTMAAGSELINNNFFQNSLGAGTTTNFNYLDKGALIINGIQTTSGNYSVTDWGNMQVNAAINGSATSTVTLTTVSGGPISSTTGSIVTANTLNLNSDYGNITLKTNTGDLNVNTTGAVSINDSNGDSVMHFGNLTPTSVSIIESGTLSIGSDINTSNGNVFLQAGTHISILQGNDIHASSTTLGLGLVEMTIGALPTTKPVAGTTPGNVTINNTGGGMVYFGSAAHLNQSITASGAASTINASGRNVIFNSNGDNTAITLEGNNTITGDPPVPGAATSASIVTPLVVQAVVSSPVSSNFSNAPMAGFGATTTNVSPVAATTATQANAGSQFKSSTDSILSSFNSNALVHADTSNGVNLTVPAVSLSSPTSASSLQALSAVSPLAAATTSTLSAVASTAQANTSSSSLAGVSSLANANALTREPLMGEVSKKHHGHAAQATASISDTHKTLESGAMILCPDHDTTVDSQFGKVQIAAKSVVVMVATDNGLSVFNIHDDARNSVTVASNGKTTDVYPGRHITISNGKEEGYEQINPGLFIPHRNMRVYEAGANKIYTSEFHIQSAIRGIEPLQVMLNSPDKDKQKMAEKVFKTMAVLQVLTGKNGSFELLTPKPVTAYLK